MRKIPFAGIELTSQRVRRLRGTSEVPGRPVSDQSFYSTLFTYPESYTHTSSLTVGVKRLLVPNYDSTTFFWEVIVKSSEEQSWFGIYILYRAQVCGVDSW